MIDVNKEALVIMRKRFRKSGDAYSIMGFLRPTAIQRASLRDQGIIRNPHDE